jgi:phage shock protein PspC (stress-responsive transcriptional regulator)
VDPHYIRIFVIVVGLFVSAWLFLR